ncbi:MAG TPA: hypothetical protein VFO55_03855 [Gemmatimonadaceae bacterium]|nr:hypothetical protein [Gemmatimonadaceae bacterium]
MNETVERFPVGRRIAFDSSRGRLWVVCGECRRWNLSPIEERFEAIEDCERLFRGTRIRVSTDNIGLARLRDGLELVRIGAPLRPEFAAWRYAGEFFSRRNRSYLRAGATVLGAAGLSAGVGIAVAPLAAVSGVVSLLVLPAIAMTMVSTTVLGNAVATDYMQHERVLGRFRVDGEVVNVRAKHAHSVDLGFYESEEAVLGLQHDGGWTTFSGTRAMHATTVLLASANREGASSRSVQYAVDQIERIGTSSGFLEAASRRNGWRGQRPVSVLNAFRKLGLMNLTSTERLAVEMAIHEETERRAAQGELLELREAWAEAEQIAAIVDGMLTPLG